MQQSIDASFFGMQIETIKLIINMKSKNTNSTVNKDRTNASFSFILLLNILNTALKAGLKENPKIIEPIEIEITIPKFNSFALYSK
jgi:hypothetical protein